MIGYVFPTSGAVCVAVAPSNEHRGDYIVLAKTDAPAVYAVATLANRDMIESGGKPERWLHADYLDYDGAVARFADTTGTDHSIVGRTITDALSLIEAYTPTPV